MASVVFFVLRSENGKPIKVKVIFQHKKKLMFSW